jgi:hypothetical protein
MRNGFYNEKDHLPDRLLRGRQLPADVVRSESSPVSCRRWANHPTIGYRVDNQDYSA